MRDVLETTGHRFREQVPDLPGHPDFACDELRLIVFLDGDFWHGRGWFEHGLAPERNRDYWVAKFERNRVRDLAATRTLRRQGWSVLRVWESDLADLDGLSQQIDRRVRLCRRRSAAP